MIFNSIGFSSELPAATLDLFDGTGRATTAKVARSLDGWNLDSESYIEAPSEGTFLLRRDASDLDDFADDPEDLSAPLSTHPPHHAQVHNEGILLPEDASTCNKCDSLCGLPQVELTVPRLFEPDFVLVRYELNLPVQAEIRICQAIDAMEAVLRRGDRCHRGETRSWHVGPWSKYRHVPRMTSIISHQTKAAKIALNDFAGLVTDLVVKPVTALIKELDPLYYRLATPYVLLIPFLVRYASN